jgi:hypothetical protein
MPQYVIFLGMIGVGRSYNASKLIARSALPFLDGNHLQSVTSEIAERPGFAPDFIIVDSPMSTEGPDEDRRNQAKMIDYIKGKEIQAVAIVINVRCDPLTMNLLAALYRGPLKNNLIILRNTATNQVSSIESYTSPDASVADVPMFNTTWGQTDYTALEDLILSRQPVTATRLVIPMSLFKDPLVIRGEVIEDEDAGLESIPVPEQVTTTTQELYVASTSQVTSAEWKRRPDKFLFMNSDKL